MLLLSSPQFFSVIVILRAFYSRSSGNWRKNDKSLTTLKFTKLSRLLRDGATLVFYLKNFRTSPDCVDLVNFILCRSRCARNILHRLEAITTKPLLKKKCDSALIKLSIHLPKCHHQDKNQRSKNKKVQRRMVDNAMHSLINKSAQLQNNESLVKLVGLPRNIDSNVQAPINLTDHPDLDLIHGTHKPVAVPQPHLPSSSSAPPPNPNSSGTDGFPHLNKQSWEYIVRSGLAGGVAGCCAKTLIAPLDRIKILFQTGNPHYLQFRGSMKGLLNAMHHISRIDGIRGFYQGHSATLLRIFPYAAIKFITYEQFRNVFIPTPQHETHFRRLLSGSCAGLCSVFVTYPLDLIRVRMAYITHKKEAKLMKVIKHIYTENNFKGLKNFYHGFMPTMYGMVPYAGVAFLTHDLFHDIFKSKLLRKFAVAAPKPSDPADHHHHRQRKVMLCTWAELISGGLAGMLSQTAAYPFEIIRRRLQVTQDFQLNSWSMAKQIFKEKGWRGFYVGLSIGYIKVTPMVACSFYIYENMKYLLHI